MINEPGDQALALSHRAVTRYAASSLPQAISQAYEVLCDNELRKRYDVYGLRVLQASDYQDLLRYCGFHGATQMLRAQRQRAATGSHQGEARDSNCSLRLWVLSGKCVAPLINNLLPHQHVHLVGIAVWFKFKGVDCS